MMQMSDFRVFVVRELGICYKCNLAEGVRRCGICQKFEFTCKPCFASEHKHGHSKLHRQWFVIVDAVKPLHEQPSGEYKAKTAAAYFDVKAEVEIKTAYAVAETETKAETKVEVKSKFRPATKTIAKPSPEFSPERSPEKKLTP
jgi:hypothetical protein